MTRYILYINLLILISSCQLNQTNKKLSSILQLPSFKIMTLDSSKCINSYEISKGRPLVFIYFSSNCEFCENETIQLIKYRNKIEPAYIYMITSDSSKNARQFQDRFRLDTMENLLVGTDYNMSFYKAYSPETIPYIAIYNGKHELKKIYKGETGIVSIINAIHNSH